MAFESLTERLQQAMSKLRRKGKVSEADVKEMMREIRLALLEADVNLQVVKEFTKEALRRTLKKAEYCLWHCTQAQIDYSG